MYLEGLILMLCFSLLILGQTDCPRQCSCKKNKINCSNRMLSSFNWSNFVFQQTFDYIDVSRNELRELPFLEVKFIDASENQIKLCPEISEAVESLSLKYNQLKYATFENCPKSLRKLDLSENPIKDLDIVCEGLAVLDLSNCDIETLKTQFLEDLPSLQILNIGDNPLKRIAGDLISSSLQELRLQRTQIRVLKPTVMMALKSLQFLDINGNKQLNDKLDLTTKAEILIANNCSFTNVDLTGMPNLSIAVLDHNLMSHISFLDSLTELYASHNRLTEINSLKGLMKADLSRNLLTNINLKPMEILNISGNHISKLKLSSMHTLDVSYCKLDTIETAGARIYSLNLSHNDLEDFSGMLTASIIDLSYNRLGSFRSHIDSIVELRLSGNRIVLAEDVVAQGRMFLHDNPWTCDCRMDHLYRLAEEPNHLFCAHPRNVSGKTWADACYRSRIPRWMLNHPYIPFVISTSLLFFAIFCFYWIRKKLDVPLQIPDNEEPIFVNTPSIMIINDQLPSYEEALLMPGIAKKVNVVTQTRSYEILSRRLSSNSI